MLGFEAARRIASGAADYMGRSVDEFRQPGAPIPVRELTGKDFSYGAAFANIGLKIMARARAEGNAALALRKSQLAEEHTRMSIAALRAKAAETPAEHTSYETVTDPKGRTYRVTAAEALRYNNPTPKASSAVKYPVKSADGTTVLVSGESKLAGERSARHDAMRQNIANAHAEERFRAQDAPVLSRRLAWLTDQQVPGGHARWDQSLKAQALDYLGIDRAAWAANDPANFPAVARANVNSVAGAGGTARPDDRAGVAAAAGRRKAMLDAAVTRLVAAKKKLYASEFLLHNGGYADDPSGMGDGGAADEESPDDFEQRLLSSAPLSPAPR